MAAGSLLSFAFPLSILISILRYRLWDIDNLINRTLVYGVVTAISAFIYFGSVLLLQRVFRTLSGQDSQLAIVISTLGIAALFNPLRNRVQDFIDRRFYRQKYDAAQALSQFAATAREEVDIEQLSNALVSVVRKTMQPDSVSLMIITKESN
jgi:hypothetical protein